MAPSEEVLAGRGDIDDKRNRMAELEAQVRASWPISRALLILGSLPHLAA